MPTLIVATRRAILGAAALAAAALAAAALGAIDPARVRAICRGGGPMCVPDQERASLALLRVDS